VLVLERGRLLNMTDCGSAMGVGTCEGAAVKRD
jgi:hypothetical protein